MNWVLVLVILILVASVGIGYKRGLLRIAYSMVSWIIVLVCVSWATPHISQYLMENTTIYQTIEQHCEETIRNSTTNGAADLVGQKNEQTETKDDEKSDLTSQGGLTPQSELESLGMNIPETVLESIFEDTAEAAEDFLDQSGIYTKIASGLANFVLDGISFLCALLFSWLIVNIISQVLGIVSHIPVLSGMNRTLGLFAGGIYGLIIVWIAFYVVALCSASDMGKVIVAYIYESRILTFLYENNLVLTLILKYF